MAATFVRLKRKRCEEPTESLLVACKRVKPAEAEHGTERNSSTTSIQKGVFKLAGTVTSKDENQAIEVYNTFTTITSLRKSDASSSNAHPANDTLGKSGAQPNYFKMGESDLAKKQEELRSLFPQSTPNEQSSLLEASARQLEEVVSYASQYTQQRQAASTSATPGNVVVYDAILNPDKKVSLISGGLNEDILCNGEAMTRLTTGAGASSMDIDNDYVYDIFCLDQTGLESEELWKEMGEIFTIEAYDENFGPFAEYRSDRLYEDDDDDSNDEDNWRNDYPDELNSSDEDDLFSGGVGRRSDNCLGRLADLALASSEDTSSGEEASGLPDYKTENPDFARYYKSYKKSRQQLNDGDESSSSEEEAYSDGCDDLF